MGDGFVQPDMKIAIFASSDTGVRIVNFFKEMNHAVSYLIINHTDTEQIRTALLETNISSKVILSNELSASLLVKGDFDIGILCWWPYLLNEQLLNLPNIGYLNFHPSYLPYNRGKGPNVWTFLENTPFGVTIHWVDASIDGGDIAFQAVINKTWEDTAESLYYKAKDEIINLFKKNFKNIITGNIPRIKQDKKTKVRFLKELNTISIDLNKYYRGYEIINLLRAKTFSGYHGCWFEANGHKYEVKIRIKKMYDE